jgi:hypothetical protein
MLMSEVEKTLKRKTKIGSRCLSVDVEASSGVVGANCDRVKR